MLELIWDVVYTVGAVYGGVWGARKYYKVGPDAPGAREIKAQQKALGR